jgi:hypothetical protein
VAAAAVEKGRRHPFAPLVRELVRQAERCQQVDDMAGTAGREQLSGAWQRLQEAARLSAATLQPLIEPFASYFAGALPDTQQLHDAACSFRVSVALDQLPLTASESVRAVVSSVASRDLDSSHARVSAWSHDHLVLLTRPVIESLLGREAYLDGCLRLRKSTLRYCWCGFCIACLFSFSYC